MKETDHPPSKKRKTRKEVLSLTDPRVLSFINLHAILGSIPLLCALDPVSAALVGKHTIDLGIAVKRGPSGCLSFSEGRCSFREDCDDDCDIRLSFSRPERFNGMIDGTVTPIPTKGLHRVLFLTKVFIPLTDRLTAFLRPTKEALADPDFFRISTTLMFHLIVRAVCCIGNEDAIGCASASYITDGAVCLSAGEELAFVICAKDHRLSVSADPQKETITAQMRFADMKTARALFDGEINAVASVGTGDVRIRGMISQVDNINRILDRVALYLA